MSARKFKRILLTCNVLLGVAFVAIVVLLRIRLNLPMAVAFLCVFPFYIKSHVFFVQFLERKGCKLYIDAMVKKEEAEEECELRAGGRPGVWELVIVSILTLVIACYSAGNLLLCIYEEWKEDISLTTYMPQIVEIFTLLPCALLLLGLSYNVWHRRVFVSANSLLVNGIAFVIILSTLVQVHYWESTPMVPNDTVFLFYMLLGCCIFFFGSLFDIAVRMKNEQDLTV